MKSSTKYDLTTEILEMPYTHSLSGLSPREQIEDVVIRACLAFDSNDKPLFQSAWAKEPDIILDINGKTLRGMERINECFDSIGPMDTQHFVSSIRIDVKEYERVAQVTANALNQHFRAGEGQLLHSERLLTGSTYNIRAVKEDDGQWKLKTWALKTIWTEGTWAVIPQL